MNGGRATHFVLNAKMQRVAKRPVATTKTGRTIADCGFSGNAALRKIRNPKSCHDLLAVHLVKNFLLKALRQNLWVKMMDFAKEDSGLRPEGFFAFVPIPKRDEKDAPPRWVGASFGLGPWIGARTTLRAAPARAAIARPGADALVITHIFVLKGHWKIAQQFTAGTWRSITFGLES